MTRTQKTKSKRAKAKAARKPDRPEWVSSMAIAAARLGCDWREVRAAARAGAPCFNHSRVDVAGLRRWFAERAQAEKAAAPDGESPAGAPPRDLADEVRHVEKMLAMVDEWAMREFRNRNPAGASNLLEQAQALARRRNDALVQLRRQGRTEEDSIPRPEVERIAHALAFNAALGLQRLADEMADKLKGITDPAQIRDILTRGLVANAFLAPFEQAVNLDAGHGLPSWVGEAMVKASKEMVA